MCAYHWIMNIALNCLTLNGLSFPCTSPRITRLRRAHPVILWRVCATKIWCVLMPLLKSFSVNLQHTRTTERDGKQGKIHLNPGAFNPQTMDFLVGFSSIE